MHGMLKASHLGEVNVNLQNEAKCGILEIMILDSQSENYLVVKLGFVNIFA